MGIVTVMGGADVVGEAQCPVEVFPEDEVETDVGDVEGGYGFVAHDVERLVVGVLQVEVAWIAFPGKEAVELMVERKRQPVFGEY